MRRSKTYEGETIEYVYHGTQLLEERHQGYTFRYHYGVGGVVGFTVFDPDVSLEFAYKKNVQGDVEQIYLIDGLTATLCTEYTYDAWGNVTINEIDGAGLGEINPIRYRGYYFDQESYIYLNQDQEASLL